MYTLKFDSYKCGVVDYFEENTLLYLDLSFKSEEEMDEFLHYYKVYGYGNGIFNYELDGRNYEGWFGSIVYDRDNNVRVALAKYTGWEDDFTKGINIFANNLKRAINNNKNAVRALVAILKDKNMLEDSEVTNILQYLPETDYGDEMGWIVDNLEEYLVAKKNTMADLRKENR